jgi:hypothetical protein
MRVHLLEVSFVSRPLDVKGSASELAVHVLAELMNHVRHDVGRICPIAVRPNLPLDSDVVLQDGKVAKNVLYLFRHRQFWHDGNTFPGEFGFDLFDKTAHVSLLSRPVPCIATHFPHALTSPRTSCRALTTTPLYPHAQPQR